MIKQNKATLKSLQAQIDAMSKVSHKDIGPNTVKSNKFLTFFKAMATPFTFIVTGIAAYGHKLPLIGKVVKIMSIWYGKTTWWKILIILFVKLRKAFVILNALIGMVFVFTITGFSFDNFIVGVSTLGYTYLEMITTLIYKLFKWLYDFLDNKVIPSPPVSVDKPWEKWFGGAREHTWHTSDMNDSTANTMEMARNQKVYKGPLAQPNTETVIVNNSWSIPNWVWYLGGAAIAVGAVYLGYTYFQDSISNMFTKPVDRGNPGTPTQLPPAQIPLPDSPVDGPTSGALSLIVSKITGIPRTIVNALNPMNYYTTSAQKERMFNNFMESQLNLNNRERTLYPFTEINPHDSYFHKIKLYCFGESLAERKAREVLALKYLKFPWEASANYVSGAVTPMTNAHWSGTVTPSGGGVNIASNVGLGAHNTLNLDPTLFNHWANPAMTALKSISHSPVNTPQIISMIPAQEDVLAWGNSEVTQIASSSQVTTEVLDSVRAKLMQLPEAKAEALKSVDLPKITVTPPASPHPELTDSVVSKVVETVKGKQN